MSLEQLLFLALFLPGLILVILVVAIVLPRALRGQKPEDISDVDRPDDPTGQLG
jgi:hypothetical protein